MRHAGVYEKKASQRDVFWCFLKVAIEVTEQRDSGRLFRREGMQEFTMDAEHLHAQVLVKIVILELNSAIYRAHKHAEWFSPEF